MKDIALTHANVLTRIIEDGIAAANRDYSRPDQKLKREGAIDGFNACRGLNNIELMALLTGAKAETETKRGTDLYWFYRCRDAEIEWVCNVYSAVLDAKKLPIIIPYTYWGMLKAKEIIG